MIHDSGSRGYGSYRELRCYDQKSDFLHHFRSEPAPSYSSSSFLSGSSSMAGKSFLTDQVSMYSTTTWDIIPLQDTPSLEYPGIVENQVIY